MDNGSKNQNSVQIKECQKHILNLLKFVDKICNEHGIKYNLTAGTMLGAVRDKGFIPWDDDGDIIFLRKEYIKFFDVIKNQGLPDNIGIYDPKEKNKFLDFNKRLYIKDIVVRNDDYNLNYYDGIFSHPTLDIYVLDKIPDSVMLNRLFVLKQQIVFGLAMSKREDITYDKYSFAERAVILFLSKFGKFFSVKALCDMHDRASMSYFNKSCNKVYATSWAPTYPKYQYDIKEFDNLIRVPFEDTMLPIPRSYDKILRYDYDDNYMEPIKTHDHSGEFVKNI